MWWLWGMEWSGMGNAKREWLKRGVSDQFASVGQGDGQESHGGIAGLGTIGSVERQKCLDSRMVVVGLNKVTVRWGEVELAIKDGVLG